MDDPRPAGLRNVVFVGLVSFFTDLATEMVYPLVPLYLTAVFGAGPALLGVIEGMAESLAAVLKVLSGYLADKYERKKPLAFTGYATSLLYKLALAFAGSWLGILAARAIDRFGKGLRTAPRDLLVSESSARGKLGRSFGLHKALDMAGAAAGILAAYFIMVAWKGGQDRAAYQRVFLLSCIPSLCALAMFMFIRETRAGSRGGKGRLELLRGLRNADSRLKLYFLVVLVFTLGNSSNAFLLLRASSLGFGPAAVILLYFLYNAASSLLSIPLGRLSDALGRKRVLVAGYAVYALVYALFAWAPGRSAMVAAFALYGLFTAATAGVERAFIAELAPAELKGTMLGIHSMIVGLALLPASLLTGFLWDGVSPEAAFALGSGLALAAAIILGIGIGGTTKRSLNDRP